jgi:hypothetical protein
MSRGFGYIRDPAHRRAMQVSSRLHPDIGNAPQSPPSASLAQYRCSTFDQGSSESCLGHGSSQLICIALGAMGLNPFVASPDGIYTVGRCAARADATPPGMTLPPLTDEGAIPSYVMAGIAKWGVRPMTAILTERYSDVSEANVNDEPSLLDLEASAGRLVVGEYRIDETAPDMLSQICACVSLAARPVGIGVLIDSMFMAYAGGPPLASLNLADIKGGHWLALDTYYPTLDGSDVVFEGPNSWGTVWGKQGVYSVTGSWLRRAISDCYAFTIR